MSQNTILFIVAATETSDLTTMGIHSSMRYTSIFQGSWQLFFKFWFVRLLALRPLLAYCASLG
jgi:hypothetical protein